MLVLAHRARRGTRHPENSLAALRAALRTSVDGVEIDVRRTADGAYVIHHDPAFADGRPVESLTLKRIRGRRLSNGEPIPTLEEFLAAASRGLVFLDLKESCRPLEVADRALDVLPSERLFFSSFWHLGIRELGRRHPGLRLGVTLEARLVHPEEAMRAAGASVLVLPASCTDAATVDAVRRARGEVWCWGFRHGDATARALTRRGVSGLIPD